MLERATLNLPASPWTDEKEAALRKHWDDGFSCSQIGAALGFTRNAIIGKARRLGLDSRREAMYRLTPEQKLERERARTRQKIARQKVRRREQNGSLPPTIIEEAPEPAEFLSLTFDDLQQDDCRFPRGEGTKMRFCGQPALAGHSYCKRCYRICYAKPPSPESRWRTSKLSGFMLTGRVA